MKPRIMYIEVKPDGVSGPARIGRVTFSKSGRSIYYRRRCYEAIKGGVNGNDWDSATHQEVWISGCKKKGGDRLDPGIIEIDDGVREEYWCEIRKMPERKRVKSIRCPGKYGDEL
jgi:hypothetical protein